VPGAVRESPVTPHQIGYVNSFQLRLECGTAMTAIHSFGSATHDAAHANQLQTIHIETASIRQNARPGSTSTFGFAGSVVFDTTTDGTS